MSNTSKVPTAGKYVLTVGLEIHAELKTKTKMFCDSKNDPDEKRPNVNICPVCMGHPGTLPVINKEAVKHVLKVGIAVGGKLADFTEFDRKNYYYPDIPKGYQLSQYKYPLVSGGELAGVALTRIHLEEDTAKSTHDASKGGGEGVSLVDFNRAGVPLMELVTEPVIKSAEQAGAFARELQLTLQYLAAGEANMEKGEMRVEANISVSLADDVDPATGRPKKFGTKVEVKNLNSFRSVERAIAYEMDRHIRAYEKGEKITQETRGWDEQKQSTYSQRAKEDSHDYRYFPDPDLPKLYLSEMPEFAMAKLSSEMAELPSAKRTRYEGTFGIKKEDIEVFINNHETGLFFEGVVAALGNDPKLAKLASNYIVSDLMGLSKNIRETSEGVRDNSSEISEMTIGKATVENVAELIKLVGASEITSRGAKDLLAILFSEGTTSASKSESKVGAVKAIAEARGFMQKTDENELKKVMAELIGANPQVVADYKAGKTAALQFFVGQGMKATKGSANPDVLKKVILSLLA